MVQGFVSAGRQSRSLPEQSRSMYFAGKACMDLYKRSRRVEDLDRAVSHLKSYSRLSRKFRGPGVVPAELRMALALKKKLEGNNNVKGRRSAVRRSPPPERRAATSPSVPMSKPARTGTAQRSVPLPVSDPSGSAAYVCPPTTGNPFWTPNHDKRLPPLVPRKTVVETVDRLDRKVSALSSRAVRSLTSLRGTGSGPHPPQTASKKTDTKKMARSAVSQAPKPPAPPKAPARPESERPIVVVIDPGHGGKDPGAVSKGGTLKEKDVTLRVAKAMKRRLERRYRNLRAVLTRDGDRYLGLGERTAVANALNADLFVSVHCNSHNDPECSGAEIYYLSRASSARAMQVAARENDIPTEQMNDVQATLLDLIVTSKKEQSERLADLIHDAVARNLGTGAHGSRDRGVRRAPFYVLSGAKMPSVLVECAFISNRREARRLKSRRYINRLADALSQGIASYLSDNRDNLREKNNDSPVITASR